MGMVSSKSIGHSPLCWFEDHVYIGAVCCFHQITFIQLRDHNDAHSHIEPKLQSWIITIKTTFLKYLQYWRHVFIQQLLLLVTQGNHINILTENLICTQLFLFIV